MVKATFDEEEKFIDGLLKYCHNEGLLGLSEHAMLRSISSSLELKYADKQEAAAYKNDSEMVKDIHDHFVKKGIALDIKAIEAIARGTKDLYLALFNILVFSRIEIRNIKVFIHKIAVDTRLPRDFRRELIKSLVGPLKNEHDALRTMQQQVNGALAAYQGKTTVNNALRSVMKTEGPSYFRRRKEQQALQDGIKNVKLALKDESILERAKVKDLKEAKKISDDLTRLLNAAIEDYKSVEVNAGMEWEEFGKLLNKLENEVTEAGKQHELPMDTVENTRKLIGKIANVVLYRYVESMHKAINQVDKEVSEAEKMLSVSLRKLFA